MCVDVFSDISVGKKCENIRMLHAPKSDVVELNLTCKDSSINIIIPVPDFEYFKAAVDWIGVALKEEKEEKQLQEQVQVQE